MIAERLDRFLALFERYVRIQEEELERAKVRDEEQRIFFARQAEAAENIASSSHASLTVEKRKADALERSIDDHREGEG
jgi:hypothetical protein